MKTKQIVTVITMLILGVLIGKYVFGNSPNSNKTTKEKKEEHWTCSMHPEIDLPEFGPCPKCGMDLIPKESNNDGLASNEFKMSKNALALANIETMVINKSKGQNKMSKELILSGKINTNDKTIAIQTAHFGGRIEQLNYRSIGEYVKKGSSIASIYSPELVTAQNEFIEALNIKNEQPELYKAVRNKLKNWKISEKQIQEIERTKKVITNFNMYANVSGFIDEILVQRGNHISEGTPLFKVSNLTSVWAIFDVYEQDIKHLKLGQHITIRSNAYPEKELKAKINFIDPNLNVATRTVQVRATLNNSKNILKPGMLLTGNLQLKKSNVEANIVKMEIPKTAVMWTGKRSIVYVKTSKSEPIFELREIDLGNESANNYEVISGLNKEEEIVVNGTFTVDAAAQLQGKSSMMNIKNNERKEKRKDKRNVVERIEVNPKFKKQLTAVINDYITLKEMFVLTDALKVKEKASQTLVTLKNINMKLLKNKEAHKIWMKELPIISNALKTIAKESDIEKQRAYFINLSNAMIKIVNNFGAKETVYVQHCPMANDSQGANWLSFQKEIKNPYFGDKMLRCGNVKQEIK